MSGFIYGSAADLVRRHSAGRPGWWWPLITPSESIQHIHGDVVSGQACLPSPPRCCLTTISANNSRETSCLVKYHLHKYEYTDTRCLTGLAAAELTEPQPHTTTTREAVTSSRQQEMAGWWMCRTDPTDPPSVRPSAGLCRAGSNRSVARCRSGDGNALLQAGCPFLSIDGPRWSEARCSAPPLPLG